MQSFSRFVYWLMLVERFGPIVINISRVINDIFTLIITYGILVIAFAFGLVFILDDTSHMVTADDGSSYFRPNDGTIGTFWHNFGNLMMGLFFIFLDPGTGRAPEIPDTTAREKFATFLYVVYNMFAITILLNLTITLMNTTIQKFENQRTLYWKFMKTRIHLEFCDQKHSLPMPFSIFHVLWVIFCLPFLKCFEYYQRKKKRIPPFSDHLSQIQVIARKKHAMLMQELISRFMNKNKKPRGKLQRTNSVHISEEYESTRC